MEPQGGNDPDSTSSEREARTERRSGAADAPAKRSLIKKGEQKGGTSSIKKHSLYLSKLSRPQRSFKNWALLRLQANQMCFSNQIFKSTLLHCKGSDRFVSLHLSAWVAVVTMQIWVTTHASSVVISHLALQTIVHNSSIASEKLNDDWSLNTWRCSVSTTLDLMSLLCVTLCVTQKTLENLVWVSRASCTGMHL